MAWELRRMFRTRQRRPRIVIGKSVYLLGRERSRSASTESDLGPRPMSALGLREARTATISRSRSGAGEARWTMQAAAFRHLLLGAGSRVVEGAVPRRPRGRSRPIRREAPCRSPRFGLARQRPEGEDLRDVRFSVIGPAPRAGGPARLGPRVCPCTPRTAAGRHPGR